MLNEQHRQGRMFSESEAQLPSCRKYGLTMVENCWAEWEGHQVVYIVEGREDTVLLAL